LPGQATGGESAERRRYCGHWALFFRTRVQRLAVNESSNIRRNDFVLAREVLPPAFRTVFLFFNNFNELRVAEADEDGGATNLAVFL
jgi:hypothetical protein